MRGARGVAIFVIPLLLAFLLTTGLVGRTFAGTTTDLTVADGSTDCPALGGTWEAGNNCLLTTSYTISSGDTLIVDSGVALEVGSGGVLTVDGILNITQLVVVFGLGVLNVAVGGVINNHNGIDVYGQLNNHGTINNITAGIYIGLYGGYTGVLDNYGVINQISIEGFAEITITDGGVLNNECGGVINNPSPGVIHGSVTEISCSGVPEFPAPAAMLPLLIAGMLIPLLIIKRKSMPLPG